MSLWKPTVTEDAAVLGFLAAKAAVELADSRQNPRQRAGSIFFGFIDFPLFSVIFFKNTKPSVRTI